jgi:hypothetical protein
LLPATLLLMMFHLEWSGTLPGSSVGGTLGPGEAALGLGGRIALAVTAGVCFSLVLRPYAVALAATLAIVVAGVWGGGGHGVLETVVAVSFGFGLQRGLRQRCFARG